MAHLAVFNPAVRTLHESVLRAEMAERMGFRSVWTTQLPDARDASLVLAAYAHATERVTLGTGVLPIYTRHPTAMAQMAATLDEHAGLHTQPHHSCNRRRARQGWQDIGRLRDRRRGARLPDLGPCCRPRRVPADGRALREPSVLPKDDGRERAEGRAGGRRGR